MSKFPLNRNLWAGVVSLSLGGVVIIMKIIKIFPLNENI